VARIFISYRRSDADMAAGRLRDALARHFGDRQIFRDRETVQPGADWEREVRLALTGDTIVLALIGPRWVTEADAQRGRVIDLPAAANRIELERALRKGLRIIPVLVGAASMPVADDLPPSLRKLTRLNAIPIRDGDWHTDVRRVIDQLEESGVRPAAEEGPRLCRLTFDGPLEKAMVIFEELANRFPQFKLTLERIESGSVVLVVRSSEEGVTQLRQSFESGALREVHGYSLLAVEIVGVRQGIAASLREWIRRSRRRVMRIAVPGWGVDAILARHFVPAGAMGSGNPFQLEHDLRRHARLNAALCGAFVAGLGAATAGLTFVLVSVRGSFERRAAVTGILIGVVVLVVVGMRSTAREWSQANLLARLSSRLEMPVLQSIIEKLINPDS
jgi:hypothetical protein